MTHAQGQIVDPVDDGDNAVHPPKLPNYMFYPLEQADEWTSQYLDQLRNNPDVEVPLYVIPECEMPTGGTLTVFICVNQDVTHPTFGNVCFYASNYIDGVLNLADLASDFGFATSDDVDVAVHEIGHINIQWPLDADTMYAIESMSLSAFIP